MELTKAPKRSGSTNSAIAAQLGDHPGERFLAYIIYTLWGEKAGTKHDPQNLSKIRHEMLFG